MYMCVHVYTHVCGYIYVDTRSARQYIVVAYFGTPVRRNVVALDATAWTWERKWDN